MSRDSLIEALPRSGSGLLSMLPTYYKHITTSTFGPLDTITTTENTYTYDNLSGIPDNYLIEIRATLNCDNSVSTSTGARRIRVYLRTEDGGAVKASFRGHLTDIDASADIDYSSVPISYISPKSNITKLILECTANVAGVISCQLEIDIMAYPAGEIIQLT